MDVRVLDQALPSAANNTLTQLVVLMDISTAACGYKKGRGTGILEWGDHGYFCRVRAKSNSKESVGQTGVGHLRYGSGVQGLLS